MDDAHEYLKFLFLFYLVRIWHFNLIDFSHPKRQPLSVSFTTTSALVPPLSLPVWTFYMDDGRSLIASITSKMLPQNCFHPDMNRITLL